MQECLVQIFRHIKCNLQLSPYPIRCALPFVEMISRDFNGQLLRILLTSHGLPYTPYETFERLLVQTTTTFRKQHEQLVVMTDTTRGLGSISRVTEVGGMGMEEELKEAYEVVKRIDVSDVNVGECYLVLTLPPYSRCIPEDAEIRVATENAYNKRVLRVECQIIARLIRDGLGTARNANEMLRVFCEFSALFVRSKIRGTK